MRTTIENLGNGLELVKEICYNKVFRKYQTLNGKLHGEEVWFYDNGQIQSKCNWIDDKKHGEDVYFYENGLIKLKRNWVDGKKHGEEIKYYENGQIERIVNWVNGELKSIIKYNEDGSLAN